MRRPVVALAIAGKDNQMAVTNNEKSTTIREGHRDYRVGDQLILFCEVTQWVEKRKITLVYHTTIRDIPFSLWRLYNSQHSDGSIGDAIKKTMVDFYNIDNLDHPITYIEFGSL